MTFSGLTKPEFKLLCAKGLARRQGLIEFVEPRVAQESDEKDSRNARAELLLRQDAGVVREVFNERYGEITFLTPASMQTELGKREALLRLVYRLYRTSRNRTPVELRRQLQASDVEALISSIQRMSFMGTVSLDELADFCEKAANQDDDLLAQVMDPLQLRYILTFHRNETAEEFRKANVDTLRAACRQRDTAAVKAWFQSLLTKSETIPGDAPQYFRSVLLELWKSGSAELGALAYEIAVLDAQLFEVLGWENTRTFCAQLRRVTGPGCEALDAFLTDEEIDGALMIAEDLNQTELVQHFRKLASSYNTKHHREMRRNVLTAAGLAREQDSVPSLPKPERVSGAAPYRPMGGWSTAAS